MPVKGGQEYQRHYVEQCSKCYLLVDTGTACNSGKVRNSLRSSYYSESDGVEHVIHRRTRFSTAHSRLFAADAVSCSHLLQLLGRPCFGETSEFSSACTHEVILMRPPTSSASTPSQTHLHVCRPILEFPEARSYAQFSFRISKLVSWSLWRGLFDPNFHRVPL